MSSITIKEFQDTYSNKWDEYVNSSVNSTFFHLIGWKGVLERTFRYKSYYIYAESHGKICGVLPLFLIKNLLSGRALVSLPFGVYGGVCADNEHIENLLIEEAKKLTKKKNSSYLELRNKSKNIGNMPTKFLYSTFIKELPTIPKDCLEFLPRKSRAAARKGINSELKIDIGLPNIRSFYDVYTKSVHNLGSPVFPIKFLKNLISRFKNDIVILIVKNKEKPIAGVFTFLFKDTILPYYGGSLPQYLNLQPNNFMYLKLMEYGVENGFRYFDFGRSKEGTGSYDFKKNQGFEPQPLYYQYYLNKINSIPDVSPLNPKINAMVKIWKHLPISITNLIGTKIIRYTPP